MRSARLLTTGQPLEVAHEDDGQTLVVRGLPVETPTPQFPVIALECASPPRVAAWAVGPYYGTVEHALEMARRRGPSVWADGQPR